MVWKIVGLVVLAWIALMVIGWVFKVLLQVIVVGAILFGVYALYKATAGKAGNPAARS